jgi:hypothetical protein
LALTKSVKNSYHFIVTFRHTAKGAVMLITQYNNIPPFHRALRVILYIILLTVLAGCSQVKGFLGLGSGLMVFTQLILGCCLILIGASGKKPNSILVLCGVALFLYG